jgi:hypothetical protein
MKVGLKRKWKDAARQSKEKRRANEHLLPCACELVDSSNRHEKLIDFKLNSRNFLFRSPRRGTYSVFIIYVLTQGLSSS